MRGTTEEEDGVSSFSDVLLLSDDVLGSNDVGEHSFGFELNGKDTPQVLCYGEGNQNGAELLPSEPSFSPASHLSSHHNTGTVDEKSSRSNKKRIGSGDGHDRVCDPKPGKRCKRDQKKSSVGNAKVRKEKVSERMTALQQLVSPYGKTDTASVLHETMGYIIFLQDQVQVLSSPYFKHHPLDEKDIGDVNPTRKVKELKTNGLCLVPLAWTIHVANTNGADLWSPANSEPVDCGSQII